MNELIAGDFLRATAFAGLDASADSVLKAMQRAHRSGACTTAGAQLYEPEPRQLHVRPEMQIS